MTDILSKAKWIWLPEGEGINQHGDFIREFTVPEDAKRVRLFISADSRYVVSINGRHVNASQFADYPEYKVADEVDVTEFVKSGKNVLTVLAHFQGDDSYTYRLGKAGLLFAIEADGEILAISDENTLCRLSREYTNGKMEKVNLMISYAFRYNANAYDGWDREDYAIGDEWVNSKETGLPSKVYSRPILPLTLEEPVKAKLIAQGIFTDSLDSNTFCGSRMQWAYLSSKSNDDMHIPQIVHFPDNSPINLASDDADGIYVVVDLGREEAGVFTFDVELPHTAEILIGYGEHLDDLRPRTNCGGRQFANLYVGKEGRQSFTYYLKRFGCRYIMLQIHAHTVKLHYVGMRPTRYPVNYRPMFKCADELHNKIAEVSRRTLELCMHEHYEDCPWREQSLYAMDSRNQMLFGYYAFGETEFPKASLRLLALGLNPDGQLELCAPARAQIVIPSFTLAYVTAVGEQVQFSGDLDFAAEMLPTIEKILASFISRIDENGTVPCLTEPRYWNFYEWSPNLDGGDIIRTYDIPKTWDAPINAWLILALKAAADITEKLGKDAQSKEYIRCYEGLREAMEIFWDEERGLYASFLGENGLCAYDELTQSLAVCAGAVPEHRLDTLLEKLAKGDNMTPVTISHSVYKYDALMMRPETYARHVKEEIGRIWGDMLYSGATSFWETAKGADDFGKAGSLCHGWSAVPLYFYYRYVLGEKLDGTKDAPAFCGLYEARREE